MVSGDRFRARTHALDSLESNATRLDDFYFLAKIMIFGKFLEILRNPWSGLILATQGVFLLSRLVEIEQTARAASGSRVSGA